MNLSAQFCLFPVTLPLESKYFTQYRVVQKSVPRECSLVLTGIFTVSDAAARVASHSITLDLISNICCKFTN